MASVENVVSEAIAETAVEVTKEMAENVAKVKLNAGSGAILALAGVGAVSIIGGAVYGGIKLGKKLSKKLGALKDAKGEKKDDKKEKESEAPKTEA